MQHALRPPRPHGAWYSSRRSPGLVSPTRAGGVRLASRPGDTPTPAMTSAYGARERDVLSLANGTSVRK